MNTSVLYFTLCFVCIWLVLSEFVGDKYITRFLILLMPNAVKEGWWDFF